jgi:hypothetical protein
MAPADNPSAFSVAAILRKCECYHILYVFHNYYFFQRIQLDIPAFLFSVSPVSVFDQHLEEDHNVNRLKDSITLWTSICSSKLLAKTQLILFLNKCDLLKLKLKRGIKVNKYLPSFGDQPNELKTVVKCKLIKVSDEQLD